MPRLYDFELSAGCYMVRLMAALLGAHYDTVPLDIYPGAEHLEPGFLALNPLGELPVLVVGDLVLRDAPAILTWLAASEDPDGPWLPSEPARRADMQSWLTMSARLAASAGKARLILAAMLPGDPTPLKAEAHRLLRVIDEHLWFGEREGRNWLVSGDAPTLADIACFPDIVLSEEADVSRQDYPAVRRWLDRVKRLPGFLPMSGVFPAGPARP